MPRHPTKREWIAALMEGFERSKYTGAVDICLRYARGSLERVMPRTCGGAVGTPCDQGGALKIYPRDNGGMTPPRLAEHLTDITERLARLVTVVDLMENGQMVDLASLRLSLERAHAHAAGLLEEVREGGAV